MSSTPAAAPAGPPDITQTFGLVALATVLGTVFYGMTLLQTGLYFGNKREVANTYRTTALVLTLLILDTLSWIMETYTTWWYFVVNYANPAQLAIPFWALQLEPGLTYTVAFLAQMFFVEKIWGLSNSHILGGVLSFIALLAWVTGLAITGIVFHQDALVSPLIDKVNIAQKTSSTIIEVSIGVLMTFLLSQRKGGLRETDNILNRLIVFALSRGLVLSLTQIAYTIVFFGYSQKLYWVIFHFSLSKLASNSVLASLNVRDLIRTGRTSRPLASGGSSSDRTRRGMGTSAFPIFNSHAHGDGSTNNISLTGVQVKRDVQFKSSGDYPEDMTMDVSMEPTQTIPGDRKAHPFTAV